MIPLNTFFTPYSLSVSPYWHFQIEGSLTFAHISLLLQEAPPPPTRPRPYNLNGKASSLNPSPETLNRPRSQDPESWLLIVQAVLTSAKRFVSRVFALVTVLGSINSMK